MTDFAKQAQASVVKEVYEVKTSDDVRWVLGLIDMGYSPEEIKELVAEVSE